MARVDAAFFDLDKTVIAKASLAAFGGPLRRGGLVSRRMVARAVAQQVIFAHFGADEGRLVKVREAVLALTRGWSQDRVRQIVREALLETVEPIIYAEALELMEVHRLAGDLVYLVSASPEEVVQPLAELLGADGSISSRAEVDAEGHYTGRMAFYAMGEDKARAVVELAEATGIDLSRSTTYTDSVSDLPLLEVVGHPVAVNPDRALARVARERGWEVRAFTKPVRLRDRVTVAAPVVTTAGLALLGALLLAWRHAHRLRVAAVVAPTGRVKGQPATL
jgi:HAD superfamily hydrolase (TIGR01490 family)